MESVTPQEFLAGRGIDTSLDDRTRRTIAEQYGYPPIELTSVTIGDSDERQTSDLDRPAGE